MIVALAYSSSAPNKFEPFKSSDAYFVTPIRNWNPNSSPMPSLYFASAVALAPWVLAYRALQFYTVGTPFDNEIAQKSLFRTLNLAIAQHMTPHLTVDDVRSLSYKSAAQVLNSVRPSVGTQIPGYGSFYTRKQDEFAADSVWISHHEDAPVLLYLHGGCFAFPLDYTQVTALINVYEYFQRIGKNVSILVADYALTCHKNLYPVQNNECAYVYDQLVADKHRDIILIGESAGAALEINLLRHIQRSKHHVWPKGVVAISPWLNASVRDYVGSFVENNSKDIVSYKALEYFGNVFINNAHFSLDNSSEVNIEANQHEVDWRAIPTIRDRKILVVLGEYEVLKDEILSWSEYTGLSSRTPGKVIVEPKGTHSAFFLSEPLTYASLEEWSQFYCTKKILAYLNELL